MYDFFGEEIPGTVFVPQDLAAMAPVELRGRYHCSTDIYNIYPSKLAQEGELLGYLYRGEAADPSVISKHIENEKDGAKALTGIVHADGSLTFTRESKQLKIEVYSLYQDIFSRNKGILESSIMEESRIVICGCGSVGSDIALELARSGVGNFLLADPDTLEYHNLCRHQCGIEDVGDLKVNALKRRIMHVNPYANVYTSDRIIQDVPKTLLDSFCVKNQTLFVGCADNRGADVYANRISIYYGAAFLSIGFWERACAGEIFYHIPGEGMPCYECALGAGSALSARVQANHHVYSTQESIENIHFEPGISADISFITCIGVKLAIDILNRNTETYRPRLLNHLTQYTLACNTCDPLIGGEMVEIFTYPLQVTTSLAVRFHGKCHKMCNYERDGKE